MPAPSPRIFGFYLLMIAIMLLRYRATDVEPTALNLWGSQRTSRAGPL